MASSSSGAPSNAFEWLSGGLFFGKSDKGGTDSIDTCKDVVSLLRGAQENLNVLLQDPDGAKETISSEKDEKEENPQEQASKFLAARLSRLRFLLYDERRESQQESSRKSTPAVAGNTVDSLAGEELSLLVPMLLSNLGRLPFESRKHVAAIFNYLLVCGLDGADADIYQRAMSSFRDYISTKFEEILTPIVDGHHCSAPGGAPDVALHCGSMYRSCLRHMILYQQLVTSTARVKRFVFPFLDTFVLSPNFDVASDAMESLRLVLTGGDDRLGDEESHKAMTEMASQFLTRDYEAIFDERFNPKLLGSDEANYMTRRMALQILSTVLLTRLNYQIMINYVASKANLVTIMILLRNTSPHITLDAFHVFKIFVANPNKPPEIIRILTDNKVKLCRYLETLHQDREASDGQFRDEKALVISTIQSL